jgi:hypothetical protein
MELDIVVGGFGGVRSYTISLGEIVRRRMSAS